VNDNDDDLDKTAPFSQDNLQVFMKTLEKTVRELQISHKVQMAS